MENKVIPSISADGLSGKSPAKAVEAKLKNEKFPPHPLWLVWAPCFAMIFPSHFYQVRVESESQALRVRVESSKNFSSRVRVLIWSSRVSKTVESLRVIGLHVRVNVESHEISHFFYYISYAIKWRPVG